MKILAISIRVQNWKKMIGDWGTPDVGEDIGRYSVVHGPRWVCRFGCETGVRQ
ncbi:hypothetical protein QG37_07470 [Candidozyma auris]|uniref:Uncharacterized protein n=1 Tax=Candidozyma auris TaxID=498019 RepID=A0A0L0NQJ8_CANAR|nr:hypothetical protein QG37_07470 [[Candida] auris]